MYKSSVHSCLEYGHLLYFGTARIYLEHLDALHCQADSVCQASFLSWNHDGTLQQLVACVHYWMGGSWTRGDLQLFLLHLATTVTRFSHLNNLSDPAQALRLSGISRLERFVGSRICKCLAYSLIN